jgi:hypothetical protein
MLNVECCEGLLRSGYLLTIHHSLLTTKPTIMLKPVLLLSIVIFLGFTYGYGQELKGRVLTEEGLPAVSVSVEIKNKKMGVKTDRTGFFKIHLSKIPDTLLFSSVGYESYQVVITEKNIRDLNFEVVMLNSRNALEDIVVTGYGTRKEDRTSPEKSRAGIIIRGSPSFDLKASSITSTDGFINSEGGFLNGKKIYMSDTTMPSRDPALLKSRILTAGEVNDFNKWKMWEDLKENEFKIYADEWGIKPQHRFSVQLKNKNNEAVTGFPVYLINKNTNDTVWKTFTDNTGKAELWSEMFENDNSSSKYIIAGQNKILSNSTAEISNGINNILVDVPCNVSNKIDIAFMVDATGSMADEIEFLKLELEDVLKKTFDRYKDLELRASAVFFRDNGDEYVTRQIDFQTDLLKLLNFIKLQSASGGGDGPEAVDSALYVALNNLNWSKEARTRLLFFVTDAPPHEWARKSVLKLIQQAAAMGIRIIPLACSGTGKSYEFLLRSMALATNGTYAFLTNHSGIGNSHIEPTTDNYNVELLNSLLQRLIGQCIYAKECRNGDDQSLVTGPSTYQPKNIAGIKIFPNPTAGEIFIESSKDLKELFISDFTGKLLKRLTPNNKNTRVAVDLSLYPSGVYFIKYITADNKWGAEKVVLQQ